MKRLITLLLTSVLMTLYATGQPILNEGFEGTEMPPLGWTATSECTYLNWYGWMLSSIAHTGEHAAMVDYSPLQTPHNSYLITPQLSISGHKLVSFWYAVNFPDYSSPTTFTLEISTTGTTPNDFTVVETMTFPTNTDYVNMIVDLGAYSGQNIYIAFHVQDEYGTGVFIDDVTVYDLPECSSPDSVMVTSTDYNGATITWSDTALSNSYQVQYALADASWDNATLVNTTNMSVTLNGLQSSSEYKVRVRTICNGVDTSFWANAITFSTLCEAITLPQGSMWMEDFESVPGSGAIALNSCWVTPQTSSYQTPYLLCGLAIASHSGLNSLELRGDNNEKNIVVLPAFTNVLNTLKLKFYANTTASSAQTSGTLEVGYITDPDDPATFTVLETVTPKAESFNRANSVPYGPFYYVSAPDGARIAIRFTSNSISTSWNLDDICVSTLAECTEPIHLQALNITANSAELSWIHQTGYLYDIFLWESGTQDTVTFNGVSIDNAPFHVDSLNASTSYSWTVRTICDDTTYAESELRGHFTTPNATMTLPYLCNFEDTSYDYSEFTFTGYGNNRWYIGTATSAPSSDGTLSSRSLYISDDQGVSNHYSGSSYAYAYASLDLSFPNVAMEYHLEFDLKVVGECGWDDFSVYLMDGGAALPNSGAPSGTALVSAVCGYSDWNHFNLILPDVTGTSKKIVFYWHNDGYIHENPPAAIDNIEINGNSCARPSHLTVSNVQDNEATLTWQENAIATSWTLHYKMQGSDNAYQLLTVSDSTTFVLQNLIPNTNYICFVTANCDDGESNPSNPISFRTLCSVTGISALPFIEDFTTYETVDGSDYVPCWSRLSSSSTHFVFVNRSDFESNCLDFHYTPNCYTMAVLPMINSAIPLNNLQLTFDARRHDLSSGALEVGAMTDPTDASTFVVIDTVPITSTYMWNNYTIYCNNYTGDAQYLAFRVNNAGYYTVVIDNLVLDYLPGCLPPTGIQVTGISENSANITWAGNADSYVLTVIGNPETIVYNTPYNDIDIQDLEPSSTYSVYVQSICSDDTSALSSRVSFHTTCGAITVTPENPWEETFENYLGTSDAVALSPCWHTPVVNQSTGVTYPTVYNYPAACKSGAYSLEMKGTSNLVVLPEFTNELNTLQLSLWLNTNAENTSVAGTLEIGYVTDINVPTSFVSVANIPATAFGRIGTDAAYTNFAGPFLFSDVTPQAGQRIAFRYLNNNNASVSWNLDDLTVTLIPDCPSPDKHSLTVNNITDEEATVSWMDNDPSHNTWCVFYKPTDSNDWMVDTVYNSQTATITGLTATTSYQVYVITYCGYTVFLPDATIERYFNTSEMPTALPYSTDFTYNDGWKLNNGDCTNHWAIRNYTPSPDDNALFITSNGLSAGYDVTANSYVSAEKVFTVGENAQIIIEFDVKVGGETSGTFDYDYMKMFLATSAETFEASTSKPSWATADYTNHAFNFSPFLTQVTTSSPYDYAQTGSSPVHIIALMDNPNPNPTANSVAKLVFCWANDYSAGTQPGAIISNLTISAVTCPQPSALNVTNIGPTEADIYWFAGQNETNWILQYREVSTTLWHTVTANTNSYHLTGLDPNTLYDLRIQSDCGDATSQFVSTTFKTNVCDPANQCPFIFHLSDSYGDGWNGASISVIQNGEFIQSLSITGSYSEDITVYLCDSSSVSLIWNSGAFDAECSITLEGPGGNTLYSNSNLGSISDLYSFITDCSLMPICYAPSNLVASNTTTTSTQLSWASNGATAFVLEYKTVTATSWEPDIYVSGNHYNLTGLTGNTTYEVRVKAQCETNNWSDWSDILIFATPSDSSIITEPTVITNSASDITHNSATLNGAITSLGNQPITSRGFEWKVSNDNIFTVVNASGTGSVFSATVNNLTPNTEYTFRAFVTTASATIYGDEETFTTADYVPTPCYAPTDLDTLSVTRETITISWIDNADANEWKVRYSTENGSWTVDDAFITPIHTITGLTENTTYHIQVQAVCSMDEVSDWSNTLTVVTKSVGLDDYLFNYIKLYPNPANDMINVECTMNDAAIEAIEVFDVYGKLIANVSAGTNDYSSLQTTQINVSGLAAGMYFVRVTTEQGVATKSFVKK